MGDGYLRTLLVVGATAVIRYARTKTAADTAWINSLLARKPARLVVSGLGQQDSPHRMGGAGERGSLPGPRACCLSTGVG